jgi:hypothetical protein
LGKLYRVKRERFGDFAACRTHWELVTATHDRGPLIQNKKKEEEEKNLTKNTMEG